ncbi:hypothetical protein [Pseudomonas frederiksbergensis]|uniref:hypothetical protein n=1 Tax=Pseudomonas frederiksbergensis TaxID=104087 RepID=UPI002DB814C0|nr:hypothetical protein [Pseudomonas frederiksbergensis]WRV66618.1 hypothetical protein VQ575_17210 [Pseudomonas frederiksbergensis]
MSFKGMMDIVKQHFVVVIVLLMMYAGGLGFLWNGYEDLNAKKIKFLEEKASSLEAQSKREMDLQKREYNVQKAEDEIAKTVSEVKSEKSANAKSLALLQIQQGALSEAQTRKDAETKLQLLMSEFSALGVNLNSNPHCGTAEDLKRYNTARSKYYEIYSLAKTYSLDKKYSDFLFHNAQNVTSFGCSSKQKRG